MSPLIVEGPSEAHAVAQVAYRRGILSLFAADTVDELLPLIVVGPSKTLTLRDVTIVHAQALPLCLQLSPGACDNRYDQKQRDMKSNACCRCACSSAQVPAL